MWRIDRSPKVMSIAETEVSLKHLLDNSDSERCARVSISGGQNIAALFGAEARDRYRLGASVESMASIPLSVEAL